MMPNEDVKPKLSETGLAKSKAQDAKTAGSQTSARGARLAFNHVRLSLLRFPAKSAEKLRTLRFPNRCQEPRTGFAPDSRLMPAGGAFPLTQRLQVDNLSVHSLSTG